MFWCSLTGCLTCIQYKQSRHSVCNWMINFMKIEFLLRFCCTFLLISLLCLYCPWEKNLQEDILKLSNYIIIEQKHGLPLLLLLMCVQDVYMKLIEYSSNCLWCVMPSRCVVKLTVSGDCQFLIDSRDKHYNYIFLVFVSIDHCTELH